MQLLMGALFDKIDLEYLEQTAKKEAEENVLALLVQMKIEAKNRDPDGSLFLRSPTTPSTPK
ncbi:hypothetical protein OS242_14020 [Tumebacillus sp. DT12]|uniref:Uncharacterized protein n=1 Tax=Tumebacillus lacus TaxID=2995335 RepID=A0ABT3X2E6_9BACL|nr:hypothetical protein [Tumebacillus lacus]MCX7571063.1 hypothetical protein [Tumebacillus lacus]